MRVSQRGRLVVLALMTVVVLGVTVGLARNILARIGRMRAVGQQILELRTEAEPLEQTGRLCAAFAERLHSDLPEINRRLERSLAANDAAATVAFQQDSAQLGAWIQQTWTESAVYRVAVMDDSTFLMRARVLLHDIDTAYRDYLTTAGQMLAADRTVTRPLAEQPGYEALRDQSRRLLNLADRAGMYADAIHLSQAGQVWGEHTQELIRIIYQLGLAALILLLSVIALLGTVSYSAIGGLIRRLRRELVERNTIIEQQRKLAHFGELTAGFAHEIRNPLTAINVRLFTLQRGLPPDSPEYDNAQMIRREVDRLDRCLKELLELARPAEPHLVGLSPTPLLNEVRDLMAPSLSQQQIELEVGETTETPFRGDPDQLKQVLINLVKNAAESIDQADGRIQLRARRDRVKLEDTTTDVVVLEVEDNGPGISAEVRSRLFEPFFSTKPHGTGLGLPLTAQIVGRHGGALEIETPASGGAIFGVVLPVAKAPA